MTILQYHAQNTRQTIQSQCQLVHEDLGYRPIFVLTTALALMGIEASHGVLVTDLLHIGIPHRMKVPSRPYAEFHIWKPLEDPANLIEIDGIICTSPAATFAHLQPFMLFKETILLADRMTCRNDKLRVTSHDELVTFFDGKRISGAKSARRALRLSQPNTDSASEGLLRLGALESGLPNPKVNHNVVLPSAKNAWLDMAYEKYGVAMEFHGQQHEFQYEADTIRMNELAAVDWVTLIAWANTLHSEHRLRRYYNQVAAALHHAGARDFRRPPMDLWTLSDGRRNLGFPD
ncbi:DUF559 domain-containing protein [Bifidobacterium leontopitheci]|uniref:DUF559 domain-containing protein n=1 Tax=Bifidobacterium leontopitheci TaxID=2650774 RepID=A0A6I1GVI3_9BIFI|nr:DUF559 domain-containing protein [Bifidobacterium leontopitheci]KAB7790461.1 hypothetical protein F7D09_1057 [Bifidobacterium leontopitheci]